MDYLIEAAKEYGLEGLAEEFLKHDSVHGIIVDLNPLWIQAYARHLKFPNDRIGYRFLEYLYRYDYEEYNSLFNDLNSRSPDYFDTIVPFDIKWYPEYWSNLCNYNNLRVRVQLRPGSRTIETAQKEQRMQVIQEHSAVPQFSSVKSKKNYRPIHGGISIGQNNLDPGTLGGILKDKKTGKKYGLSCAHVISSADPVEQPSRVDSSKYGTIGNCVYKFAPKSNFGQLCNPFSSNLNKMDIALIEIDSAIVSQGSILNIGSIKNFMPAADLHQNLKIEYNGRSSGHQTLATGGISYSQEIEDSSTGEMYCFTNLIELKRPSLLQLLFKKPVKSGDSGSWIVASGKSGLEWCGMIIGTNNQSGYAIRSEDILKHLAENEYDLEI